MLQTQPLHYSINYIKPNGAYLLSKEIYNLITKNFREKNQKIYSKDIVILCIGTDRSTGDSLGPLVGYRLANHYSKLNVNVLGTLKDPVHAKNLEEKINYVYDNITNPFIIAIDASLGRMENIGKINLYNGPIFPGAGVNKSLQPVGDISLTGIVNMSGFMEYLVLQNTRLSIVMDMADIISLSIYMSISKMSYDDQLYI